MGKTIAEWQDFIEAEKASKPELEGINTASATGVWKNIRDTFAFLAWVLENLFTTFKKEVDQRIAESVPFTDRWLANEVARFQYGDPLSFDPETWRYYYPVVDPAKRIITQVAVTSANGIALVKVRKADGPLGIEEITALTAYVNEFQVPGSNISIISKGSDLIRLPLVVYYDALYEVGALRAAVEAAVEAHITTLPFNGAFYLSRLLDAVKAVPGVKDVAAAGVTAKFEGGAGGGREPPVLPRFRPAGD
ncbi:hypothetical protein [Rufibacter quisquiliarum]|uniref:Baseplate protein J-like domain-containing protein n=1 Tax=Rufibacter quisquiliarum TaxID=1549639 RepID=A0A839GJV6_9BACT|nr:hypothetical protein [Rufibacter quisquiliarum]MBA9078930.1 hypothetical protein [Rufibacter quisquiliarum]